MTTSTMGGILKQLATGLDEALEKKKRTKLSQKQGSISPDFQIFLHYYGTYTIITDPYILLSDFHICIDGLDGHAVKRRPELPHTLPTPGS